MSEPINGSEIKAIMVHLKYIKDGIDELKKQNEEQYGRLNTLEKDMGVIQDSQKKSFVRDIMVGVGAVLLAIGAMMMKAWVWK